LQNTAAVLAERDRAIERVQVEKGSGKRWSYWKRKRQGQSPSVHCSTLNNVGVDQTRH